MASCITGHVLWAQSRCHWAMVCCILCCVVNLILFVFCCLFLLWAMFWVLHQNPLSCDWVFWFFWDYVVSYMMCVVFCFVSYVVVQSRCESRNRPATQAVALNCANCHWMSTYIYMRISVYCNPLIIIWWLHTDCLGMNIITNEWCRVSK